MRWPRRQVHAGSESPESPLEYHYYVDSQGLRALADSLGIELPVSRERSSEGRLRFAIGRAGGERARRDTTKLEAQIPLNGLAAGLKESGAYRDVVDVLGLIPRINDRGILDAAISHLRNMPPPQPGEDALEGRLQAAYDAQRKREIMRAKREELRQVAKQNQLVILRGTFVPVSGTAGLSVRLTHLEPVEVVFEESESPGSETDIGTVEMPMPDEVGIVAVLPAAESFTAAGRERLTRRAPFYGRIIGHSASFDEGTGVLTCSAFAVWGMSRPARLMKSPGEYEFLEKP